MLEIRLLYILLSMYPGKIMIHVYWRHIHINYKMADINGSPYKLGKRTCYVLKTSSALLQSLVYKYPHSSLKL